jgi:hypothetical protein
MLPSNIEYDVPDDIDVFTSLMIPFDNESVTEATIKLVDGIVTVPKVEYA